ncbi:hypothetical protein EV424DRAFT_1353855 [Suillus variegatus]|nr:hypothetical protein EV424DRAFT_1353855 [Suillus variegatus]
MSDRDFASDPRLIVIRSFDVNMSAAEVDEPKKWFFILTDVLRARAEVKIRPGIVTNDTQGRNFCISGGLIGIRTKINPTLCRADRLVGQVLGAINPELEIILFLLWAFVEGSTDFDFTRMY